MSSSSYGRTLNPFRQHRRPFGAKATRQSVTVTNNPSSIAPNQMLIARFPNLGDNDLIVPGTARLAFTIALTSTDVNRTLVQNIGRAVVKKITIKVSGNEVLSIDDSDVYHCYTDLWKTATQRASAHYQGIDETANRNATKLRVGAADKSTAVAIDQAIATTYGNRFYVPLDFELLECAAPFYQSGLGDRLEYELTFNDYSRVIQATGAKASESSYTIDNIALEFDQVTSVDLARHIQTSYKGRLAILYDRVLRHRMITKNKSDTVWNININVPAKSMKGVLMLFENQAAFTRDTESFYNPKITKVEAIIEGVPNKLYSQGLRPHHQWEETRKLFAAGSKLHPETGSVAKDLALADVSLGEFLTSKYALWLDMRSTDDDSLHGSGVRVENGSEGITLQISKKAETAGALNIYLYIIMDAQLNLAAGRFVSALY